MMKRASHAVEQRILAARGVLRKRMGLPMTPAWWQKPGGKELAAQLVVATNIAIVGIGLPLLVNYGIAEKRKQHEKTRPVRSDVVLDAERELAVLAVINERRQARGEPRLMELPSRTAAKHGIKADGWRSVSPQDIEGAGPAKPVRVPSDGGSRDNSGPGGRDEDEDEVDHTSAGRNYGYGREKQSSPTPVWTDNTSMSTSVGSGTGAAAGTDARTGTGTGHYQQQEASDRQAAPSSRSRSGSGRAEEGGKASGASAPAASADGMTSASARAFLSDVDRDGDSNAALWEKIAVLAEKYEKQDEELVHRGRRAGDIIYDEQPTVLDTDGNVMGPVMTTPTADELEKQVLGMGRAQLPGPEAPQEGQEQEGGQQEVARQ